LPNGDEGFVGLTAVVTRTYIFCNMTLCEVESQPPLRRKQSLAFRLFQGVFFSLGLPFNLEDGNNIFLRNVGWLSADYIALGTD
jgi:hypothetical protein